MKLPSAGGLHGCRALPTREVPGNLSIIRTELLSLSRAAPRIDNIFAYCLGVDSQHFVPAKEVRMTREDQNSRVTRRNFFAQSARVIAGAGLLKTSNSARANVGAREVVSSGLGLMPGKIALEEHFVIPETLGASYGAPGSPEFRQRLEEIGSARIAEMD